MPFETFTGTGCSFTGEPKVTILKQGNFNFNATTLRILQEHRVEYLQLLYDKDSNRIAFKPCTKTDEGAYAMRVKKNTGQVSGTAFLKCYGISFGEQTRSYPAAWNAEQSLLIVNLG